MVSGRRWRGFDLAQEGAFEMPLLGEYPTRGRANMREMSAPSNRIPTLTKLAWACAALVLAITTLSAFIRLSHVGLGCEPWPQCYARSAQSSAAEPPDTLVAAARIAHRVVAVIALLLVIALVMNALSTAPVLWREGRMALGLLALALFLAILGRWTAGARLPAVMLGNLLAGFAMFALSCLLAWTAGQRPAVDAATDRMARWATIGAAVLVAQIVLGGLVSAGHAGLSCPGTVTCDFTAGSWQFLHPWQETTIDAGNPANPAGALVHGLHRVGALVVLAVLLPLGVAAWRSGRRAGAAVVLLLVVQATLGATLVATGLPLPIALAHNAVSALLLAAVVVLAAGTTQPASLRKTSAARRSRSRQDIR
jgi:heme a synthase